MNAQPELSSASDHTGPVIGHHDAYTVIDCSTCGWPHLDPLPGEDEVAQIYEGVSYYGEESGGWLDKDRSEQSFWDLEHADKLADWASILGRPTGAVLDVGCSGGLLLEYALAHGWQGEGVEPSELAAAEAREHGVSVHCSLYQVLELPAASFDVVHSKLLAEHLPDPAGFCAWAARVLRPGGVLTVHVPNDFNQLQLAARDTLGLHDWWVAPPFHLNYFSYDSLERLLRRCGFSIVGRDATFPMEWFLLMGENYVLDERLGASAHRRRMLFEQRLETLGQRRALHAHLAAEDVGREAIVHARYDG
jgi:SAM-dependent methyltransferase